MRKGKKIAVAKKTAAAFLTAAMVTGMLPAGQIQNVMAADDSPYVISTGRMVYASSSVGNSDPAYAVDGSTGTRWESAWNDNTEWIYIGKVLMPRNTRFRFQMTKKIGVMFMLIPIAKVEMRT